MNETRDEKGMLNVKFQCVKLMPERCLFASPLSHFEKLRKNGICSLVVDVARTHALSASLSFVGYLFCCVGPRESPRCGL